MITNHPSPPNPVVYNNKDLFLTLVTYQLWVGSRLPSCRLAVGLFHMPLHFNHSLFLQIDIYLVFPTC